MKRFPAFDPPEYLDWTPDQALVDQYISTIVDNPERRELVAALSEADKLALYEGLLRNRLHDIALKRWVRQGVISKAWLGTGEEAATIGPVFALRKGDIVAPMIRNAGACHQMGMTVTDMLRGYLGSDDSPTRGRDLHIGDIGHGVIAPISQVGAMVPVMVGVTMAFQMRGEDRVGLTWIGDGSTKAGQFYEGMNLGGTLSAPLVVIVQNNQVALGTRVSQHHRGSFMDWPDAFGLAGASFDGNNVLDAYAATRQAVDACRAGHGPVLLVTETFRMGGHATHDEREARATFDAELFEFWGKRDPVGLYEEVLVRDGVPRDVLEAVEHRIATEVESAAEEALKSRQRPAPTRDDAAKDVFYEAAHG